MSDNHMATEHASDQRVDHVQSQGDPLVSQGSSVGLGEPIT